MARFRDGRWPPRQVEEWDGIIVIAHGLFEMVCTAPADRTGAKSCGERPLAGHELDDFLNLLVEAMRAEAKSSAVFACWVKCPEQRAMFLEVQQGTARAIAELGRLLKQRGCAISEATSPFFDKALQLPPGTDRTAFLNRGYDWLVATMREALPRIHDHQALHAVSDLMAACEANRALASIPSPTPDP